MTKKSEQPLWLELPLKCLFMKKKTQELSKYSIVLSRFLHTILVFFTTTIKHYCLHKNLQILWGRVKATKRKNWMWNIYSCWLIIMRQSLGNCPYIVEVISVFFFFFVFCYSIHFTFCGFPLCDGKQTKWSTMESL